MCLNVRCLLLVDDEPADAANTQVKLAKVEVESLLVAHTLAQAVRYLRQEPIDVVLLDLNLEDSREIDTLTAVRSLTDAVIIVLADCDNELLGVQAMRAGADEYLFKSDLDESVLLEAISKNLVRRNVRRTASRMQAGLETVSRMAGVGSC
jgi:DNA-binding NarL/FixJ family response regulator